MKETMKQHLHAAERKTIQSMIRREYDGWPPLSATFFYQPHRPESRCPNRRTKSKSHAAVLSPSHLKCGGLFLLILLNFTVNVESMLAAFLWVKKLLALYIAKLERFLQVIPLY